MTVLTSADCFEQSVEYYFLLSKTYRCDQLKSCGNMPRMTVVTSADYFTMFNHPWFNVKCIRELEYSNPRNVYVLKTIYLYY